MNPTPRDPMRILIDDMQQQIRIHRLLQRGLEGIYQAVRQISDKADGVG